MKDLIILFPVVIHILHPLIFSFVIVKIREQLQEAYVKRKIGSLTLDLRTYKLSQSLYSVFFLIRRLMFAAVIIVLRDKPGLTIGLIPLLNILWLTYICVTEPHNSRGD